MHREERLTQQEFLCFHKLWVRQASLKELGDVARELCRDGAGAEESQESLRICVEETLRRAAARNLKKPDPTKAILPAEELAFALRLVERLENETGVESSWITRAERERLSRLQLYVPAMLAGSSSTILDKPLRDELPEQTAGARVSPQRTETAHDLALAYKRKHPDLRVAVDVRGFCVGVWNDVLRRFVIRAMVADNGSWVNTPYEFHLDGVPLQVNWIEVNL